MWRFFELDLRHRLSDLDAEATVPERVQAALLELLPSGDTTMEAVLVGFEDPDSFVRAFHAWTGETPEQARRSMRRTV